MANVFSTLVGLSDAVRLWFAARTEGVSVPPVGWRQRVQKLNEGTGRANRVLFMPGAIASGDVPEVTDLGKLLRGRQSSNNPRVLFEWDIPFTMSVWAVDMTDRNDEQLQIIAVTNLLELALQAVHNARLPENPGDPASPLISVGLANLITPATVRIVTRNAEQYFGREILVGMSMKTPLYDKTFATGTGTPALHPDPPRS